MVVAQKYHILKYTQNVEWLLYHNVQDLYGCSVVINVTKLLHLFSFQKHKELFKKTLIVINVGAEEAARLQALRDAKEAARLQAARLQALRDAEKATRLQALRDAEEAARLQALHVCRSFSSNVGQCFPLGKI